MSARAARGAAPGVVAALGAPEQVAGFGLAGARVVPVRTEPEVLQAWAALADAALLILTPQVARWLGDRRMVRDAPLTVVLPE